MWLLFLIVMLISACTGFYVGALFEKEKMKRKACEDKKVLAYHLGKDALPRKKGNNELEVKTQSSDIKRNMKGQDKKYCRLKK